MADARRAQTLVAAVACLAGAYAFVRYRPARRVAWQLVRVAATTWLPAWVASEVRQAWRQSAHEPGTEGGT
ncbi:MAG: hypothetical protein KJ066_16385 [Acidobacteria bacterium]|nr:hypothetical protein [Acidobacteriota bacterium]